jgi:V-type H+-transporting ATPase subunit E
MEYRIRRSTSINNSRVKKMEARNQAMMKVFSEAQYMVFRKIRDDPTFYKELLVKLIW